MLNPLSLTLFAILQTGSPSFELTETIYCQGSESQTLTSNLVESNAQTVAPDFGGNAKSNSYLLAASFLTEEFSLSLETPYSLSQNSFGANSMSREFVWSPASDTQFVDGFRLQVYATPDRNSPQTDSYDIASPSATTGSIPISPGETCFVDLVSYKGTSVESAPTEMVKVSHSFNASQGDANGDGVTDGADLIDALASFGSMQGTTGWNPGADLDGNGQINQNDIDKIAQKMGWRAQS